MELADGCFAPDPFVRRQHALALLSQTFDNRGRVGQGTQVEKHVRDGNASSVNRGHVESE